MTYAGMQSLIYANVDKNDPRVKLALKWLENSYSLDENPGMGVQGLYYYYQAMSKALSAMGIDTLTLETAARWTGGMNWPTSSFPSRRATVPG